MKPWQIDVSSRYGAPMGRRGDDALDFDLSRPLHLERVRLVDGDYDEGGAYWGGPPSPPLWAVRDEEGHVIYFRAQNRGAASRSDVVGALKAHGARFSGGSGATRRKHRGGF